MEINYISISVCYGTVLMESVFGILLCITLTQVFDILR